MQSKKRKIGIVGCGTIGSAIAKAIKGRFADRAEVSALCDRKEARAEDTARILGRKVEVAGISKLMELSDLVVESSSVSSAKSILEEAIVHKRDIMVMSSGALLGAKALFERAKKKGIKVYIPSGALAGLDGIKAAGIGGIDGVTLTTRKPPRGFEGAPFVVEKKIDLKSISRDTLLFEGTPEDAVKAFPANINVAATLSLAACGARDIKIRVVASPASDRNVHEVDAVGAFGRLTAKTENLPSPDNPKTSTLAVLSAVRMLEDILGGTKIGG